MRRAGRVLAVISLVAASLLAAGTIRAQQVERIVAVVNDEPISGYDLESRITLVVRSSRLPDTPEMRSRLAPQVLRTLINEQLQLQEAKRRNISVRDQEIKGATALLAKQNNVPADKFTEFLERLGVPERSLTRQIRAQIAWQKLLQRQFRARIQIGDDEIEEERARLIARHGETEYLLAELFLDVPTPEEEAEVKRSIERLAEQIRRGASFPALARQFSQSATASVGGDLGWAVASELGDSIRDLALKMRPGDLSEPIRTVSGYTLFLMRDKRSGSRADPKDIKLTLGQIYLPFSDGASPAEIATLRARAAEAAAQAGHCAELPRIAKTAGSTRPAELGTLALADLSGDIRSAVAPLAAGKATEPMRNGNGWLVLLVCKRDEPEVKPPGPEEIREALARQRLELQARRYLRDIRRSALIDIRV